MLLNFAFCLLILSSVLSLLTERFALFKSLSINFYLDQKLDQHIIYQKSLGSKINCNQLCLRIIHCLSFQYNPRNCVLFSFDSRSSEISLTSKTQFEAETSQFYGISEQFDNPQCFVEGTKAGLENCEIENKQPKPSPNNCTEWSSWVANFHEEICPGVRLFSTKNRSRYCPNLANGNLGCDDHIFEEKTKVPILHRFEKTPYRKRDGAISYCVDKQSSLFSNVFVLTQTSVPYISEADMRELQRNFYYIHARFASGQFKVKDQGLGLEYFNECAKLNSNIKGSKTCAAVKEGKIINIGCSNRLRHIVCEKWVTTRIQKCSDQI